MPVLIQREQPVQRRVEHRRPQLDPRRHAPILLPAPEPPTSLTTTTTPVHLTHVFRRLPLIKLTVPFPCTHVRMPNLSLFCFDDLVHVPPPYRLHVHLRQPLHPFPLLIHVVPMHFPSRRLQRPVSHRQLLRILRQSYPVFPPIQHVFLHVQHCRHVYNPE